MAVNDNLQYIESVVLALIVSFLLAKLFSIIFSSGDESTLSSTAANPNETKPDVIPRRKPAENVRRSEAEFTRKEIAAAGSGSDDDWEGVETTELDEAFCAANAFVAAVAADRSSQKVSYDLKLKLYGLYKIATEGACSVPQPSAIKITARAKWNAWYKLGAMSQEEAMQKYLDTITELYPNWSDGSTFKRRGGDDNGLKDTKPMGPDLSSFVYEDEFKLDDIDDFTKQEQTRGVDHQTDAEIPPSTNADMNLKDNEGQTILDNAAVGEPGETGAKKNAATGVDDDGSSYPSDLSQSNWHSIEP